MVYRCTLEMKKGINKRPVDCLKLKKNKVEFGGDRIFTTDFGMEKKRMNFKGCDDIGVFWNV